MGTRVSSVIERKGSAVTTIPPSGTVADAAALLTRHGIGSLVVTADGATIEGMLSERDIVRCLAEAGSGAGQVRVAELERDRQRALGARLQLVDVRPVARHERELEPTPLHARSDLVEKTPCSFEPPPTHGLVAQCAGVQLGETERDAHCLGPIAALAETAEGVLPVAGSLGEAIVEVVDAAADVARGRLVVSVDDRTEGGERLVDVSRHELPLRRSDEACHVGAHHGGW